MCDVCEFVFQHSLEVIRFWLILVCKVQVWYCVRLLAGFASGNLKDVEFYARPAVCAS